MGSLIFSNLWMGVESGEVGGAEGGEREGTGIGVQNKKRLFLKKKKAGYLGEKQWYYGWILTYQLRDISEDTVLTICTVY